MPGAEVPARLDRLAPRAGLQMDLRIAGEEIGREADNPMPRAGNLQMGENLRRHEFIYENPAVLRVILKLDDVIVAIVGFQQMRLRATPHLADEPARVYRHTI